jgi:RND family efflux transporter MFP subunit
MPQQWNQQRALYPLLCNVLVLLAIAAIIGCDQAAQTPPAKPVAQRVKTMVLTDSSALIGRSFPGTVRATNRVDLSFEVAGTLQELPVKQGQQVKQGRLLALLDARDYQARVDATRAEYEKALSHFRRAAQLVKKGHVSRANYDQTVARRDVTAADLAKAEKALEQTAIRAPFAGVVARRFVENFTDVRAKQAIMSLQDTEKLELVVDAPENIVVLQEDQAKARLVATLNALPGQEFPVTVKEYATIANPETQTFEYVFALPERLHANVFPGMTAAVTIVGLQGEEAQETVFVVPASAVVSKLGEAAYVWLIEPERNIAVPRVVVVDEPDGSGQLTVREGLAAGDVIATAGVHHLTEGMPVIPVTRIRF